MLSDAPARHGMAALLRANEIRSANVQLYQLDVFIAFILYL